MAEAKHGCQDEPGPSRALVPVEVPRGPAPGGDRRPLATFITQMVACHTMEAEFRKHRRAPPPDAIAAYRSARKAPRPSGFERVL